MFHCIWAGYNRYFNLIFIIAAFGYSNIIPKPVNNLINYSGISHKINPFRFIRIHVRH